MNIIARFEPTNMTAERYAEVLRRLDAQGLGAPAGRLHHVSYGDPARLHVIDVWESAESFERFGAQLMPVLESLGVEIGRPIVAPVHKQLAHLQR